jgi:hypothetical protein
MSQVMRWITGGSLALLVCMGINAFGSARQREQAHQDNEASISAIENQKRLADAASANQITPIDSLIVANYTKSGIPPKLDLASLRLRSPVVKVIDRNQVCIGAIVGNRFLFDKYYLGVCDESWLQKEIQEAHQG